MATKSIKFAQFSVADAKYIAERIGELNRHAVIHDGKPCAKLNRARIGGMIEVLSRMNVEVHCDWTSTSRNVVIDKCIEPLLTTVRRACGNQNLLTKQRRVK